MKLVAKNKWLDILKYWLTYNIDTDGTQSAGTGARAGLLKLDNTTTVPGDKAYLSMPVAATYAWRSCADFGSGLIDTVLRAKNAGPGGNGIYFGYNPDGGGADFWERVAGDLFILHYTPNVTTHLQAENLIIAANQELIVKTASATPARVLVAGDNFTGGGAVDGTRYGYQAYCQMLKNTIEYDIPGVGGNAITIQTIADSVAGVYMTGAAPNYVFHFEDSVSTCGVFETAVNATGVFTVKVASPSPADVLNGDDAYAARLLSGGTPNTGTVCFSGLSDNYIEMPCDFYAMYLFDFENTDSIGYLGFATDDAFANFCGLYRNAAGEFQLYTNGVARKTFTLPSVSTRLFVAILSCQNGIWQLSIKDTVSGVTEIQSDNTAFATALFANKSGIWSADASRYMHSLMNKYVYVFEIN